MFWLPCLSAPCNVHVNYFSSKRLCFQLFAFAKWYGDVFTKSLPTVNTEIILYITPTEGMHGKAYFSIPEMYPAASAFLSTDLRHCKRNRRSHVTRFCHVMVAIEKHRYWSDNPEACLTNSDEPKNYIHIKRCKVITHACLNFNGGFVKPSMKLVYGCVSTRQRNLWVFLLIHALGSSWWMKAVHGFQSRRPLNESENSHRILNFL